MKPGVVGERYYPSKDPNIKSRYISLEKMKKKKAKGIQRAEKNKHPLACLTSHKRLPSSVSLKSKCHSIFDQKELGSCTSNAICAAVKMMELHKNFEPSRLYVYWKERLIEDGWDPNKITDSGADFVDGIDWATKHGICSEDLWPYDISKANIAPPDSCDEEAKNHKIGKSVGIPIDGKQLQNIKAVLFSGQPVLLAIMVYESFESDEVASTGIVPMPKPDEKVAGGHEVLIIGYNDRSQVVTVLNSWGSNWGLSGYFLLPYAYLQDTDLTTELYTISPF